MMGASSPRFALREVGDGTRIAIGPRVRLGLLAVAMLSAGCGTPLTFADPRVFPDGASSQGLGLEWVTYHPGRDEDPGTDVIPIPIPEYVHRAGLGDSVELGLKVALTAGAFGGDVELQVADEGPFVAAIDFSAAFGIVSLASCAWSFGIEPDELVSIFLAPRVAYEAAFEEDLTLSGQTGFQWGGFFGLQIGRDDGFSIVPIVDFVRTASTTSRAQTLLFTGGIGFVWGPPSSPSG